MHLKCLKNGCIDVKQASLIPTMDLKTLTKEYIHCTNITYRQYQFTAFLNSCSLTLNLSNPARRVFDHLGNEHFDLSKLTQNGQLVYITMGEAWIPPKHVKDEQERKCLLTNLVHDLNKISYFNQMKQCCRNFVIEASCNNSEQSNSGSNLHSGSSLIVAKCCFSEEQIERVKQGELIQNIIDSELRGEDGDNNEPEEEVFKYFNFNFKKFFFINLYILRI
jgi:hypothetical protein